MEGEHPLRAPEDLKRQTRIRDADPLDWAAWDGDAGVTVEHRDGGIVLDSCARDRGGG